MGSSRTRPESSSIHASRRMRAVRQRNTKPELALQRELRFLGLRFTLDAAPEGSGMRRADILFRQARCVVFVDGCFWHSCPKHATIPKANREWWEAKLATNRSRDLDTSRKLKAAGYAVIRVWAHENMERAARRIHRRIEATRSRSASAGLAARSGQRPAPARRSKMSDRDQTPKRGWC